MENKTVLLGLDRFLTPLYLCRWFIMKSFRTTSPRHKINQFLPLNSLWSWVCIRCFPTSTAAIRSAVDTITATMITTLFPRHVVRQLIAADTCLPLVSDGCCPGRLPSEWTWSTTIAASLSTAYPFLCHVCQIYFVINVNFSELKCFKAT